MSSHYYSTSILLDILTKREQLYRSFFKKNSYIVEIPKSLSVTQNNTLLKEIKATYSFIDPTTYCSEVTREFLYDNSNFLKYTIIKDFLKTLNSVTNNLPINFSIISNYFVHLLGPIDNYSKLNGNTTLFKSQYRPMKKGVTNMIRLQATNAIAMPTEIRLHILASSKDVIHS
jgi:hypothetical protein